MADFEITGLDELIKAVGGIGNIPNGVKTKTLEAMAKKAAEKIKSEGEAMRVYDMESSEHILDKITTAKPKLFEDGGRQDVTFKGSRTRGKSKTRNAAIAYINEFGKSSQPARPFIGTAMSKNADEITATGADILGDWIENEYKK